MTVRGIGNDLVEVQRIAKSLEKHGARFVEKILTQHEQAGFSESKRRDNFLAKRFAVKEAVSKALGTGIAQGVSWQDIELGHREGGQPFVTLRGNAKSKLAELNAETVHVSISDESGLVSAFAVIS